MDDLEEIKKLVADAANLAHLCGPNPAKAWRIRLAGLITILVVLAAPLCAAAHVTVWPRQSDQGAREKYLVRVPNEKQAATVRLEARFPPELRVVSFEQKAGWSIAPKRDGSGAIVGAIWTGDLPPDQFVEFGIMAVNPKSGQSLTWTFRQVYADGLVVQWSGAPGSATPAPVVQLRPAAATETHP